MRLRACALHALLYVQFLRIRSCRSSQYLSAQSVPGIDRVDEAVPQQIIPDHVACIVYLCICAC